jgi:riboflavin kinase / FMN adenylyltransferase
METIHFPDQPCPSWITHPVLALGNFDGLHRGHLKIIERVKRGAAERGGTPMAMTFDPHPPRIVRPDKAPPLLMTTGQRLAALHHAGLEAVAVVRFTTELSHWDAETFVRRVLVDWLRVSEVWVGANFLFGHDRLGNFSLLRSLGHTYGFRAEKIDPVRYRDFIVSSTRVRRLVAEGRVDEAGALLGRVYAIDGVVVEGRRRGRELGFPTANLETENELIPPHGVYATIVTIGGVQHGGVTNIGTRPTFGESGSTIETHILAEVGDLYGRPLRVAFVQRLRDERRFEDVDALRSQIDADRQRAERLFARLAV